MHDESERSELETALGPVIGAACHGICLSVPRGDLDVPPGWGGYGGRGRAWGQS